MQHLFDAIKLNLSEKCISYTDFSKYVLNCTNSAFEDLIYFDKLKFKSANILSVNAIYKWLKDEKRLEKYKEAKFTGKFIYIDENDIEEYVQNMFA
jgi:hypothetical protein